MGEIAGLLTALFWACSATLFAEGSKQVGPGTVNRVRLLIALFILMVGNLLSTGQPIPFQISADHWFWLAASGILGLAIGDGLMYQAYVLIGTQISMLMTAFSPILSAIIAWFFLGEKLELGTTLGIILAVSGVALVVLERGMKDSSSHDKKKYGYGLLISFIAVCAYAIGMVMSKKGLEGDILPISGVVIRMIGAVIAGWIPAIFTRELRSSFQKLNQNRRALKFVVAGSFLGPSTGIWFSFIALQNTHVGVASTLISTAPIFVMIIARFLLKETVTLKAWIGTAVAMAGVAVIFLVK